ncbi:uncharacterized protein LAJ45_00034 [Morchella importuna]|uniref:uncharacterized protein n=1 Tax=Morchella importuna TaxID=1174673 RepID=UPI001E8D203D|nr:uncharacterized protein LAJ45_00034 [Morchella importuna]KAH8155026.1 hypothetical protein LAJ45_00034 [Morchella importuna]
MDTTGNRGVFWEHLKLRRFLPSKDSSRTYIDREIHLEPVVAMSQSLTAPPPPSRMLFYHPRTSQKQLSITLFLNPTHQRGCFHILTLTLNGVDSRTM